MKKLLLILSFVCAALCVSAQNMRAVFLDAPEWVFPLLTKNCRADLVDFVEAGMKAEVRNRLDGVSVLNEFDDDYLKLATTASSTMQLKLLPAQDDTVMCVVKTVKAEAADSRIYFYDRSWNLLNAGDRFQFPSIKDFFTSPSAADEYIDVCDIYLVALTLSADENTLVAEYTMPSYMNTDDAKTVAPLLRKLEYRWNGERFVIE
ncbi:MAG: DUF3256 family protein [Bacteroidaceae bacterium]|nr:DUF3256 family protein [Bacteroidaceae bacterium]